MRLPLTTLALFALTWTPALGQAQPTDPTPEPIIDVDAAPRLAPVPEGMRAEVEELRRHVRRTNRCRAYFARTIALEPQSCRDELAIVEATTGEVRSHAIGLELVRSLMIPRGQRGPVRYHAIRWAVMLQGQGEVAVRYLIRALSLLDQESINHSEIAHAAAASLQRITRSPVAPCSPWDSYEDYSNDWDRFEGLREVYRRAWADWYRAHGDESLAQWRAAGLRMHRANLSANDPVLRLIAVRALWYAEVPDREAIARAQLASPGLYGRARRSLHRSIVSHWRLMPWREASRVTRDAMRQRAQQRRAARAAEQDTP